MTTSYFVSINFAPFATSAINTSAGAIFNPPVQYVDASAFGSAVQFDFDPDTAEQIGAVEDEFVEEDALASSLPPWMIPSGGAPRGNRFGAPFATEASPLRSGASGLRGARASGADNGGEGLWTRGQWREEKLEEFRQRLERFEERAKRIRRPLLNHIAAGRYEDAKRSFVRLMETYVRFVRKFAVDANIEPEDTFFSALRPAPDTEISGAWFDQVSRFDTVIERYLNFLGAQRKEDAGVFRFRSEWQRLMARHRQRLGRPQEWLNALDAAAVSLGRAADIAEKDGDRTAARNDYRELALVRRVVAENISNVTESAESHLLAAEAEFDSIRVGLEGGEFGRIPEGQGANIISDARNAIEIYTRANDGDGLSDLANRLRTAFGCLSNALRGDEAVMRYMEEVRRACAPEYFPGDIVSSGSRFTPFHPADFSERLSILFMHIGYALGELGSAQRAGIAYDYAIYARQEAARFWNILKAYKNAALCHLISASLKDSLEGDMQQEAGVPADMRGRSRGCEALYQHGVEALRRGGVWRNISDAIETVGMRFEEDGRILHPLAAFAVRYDTIIAGVGLASRVAHLRGHPGEAGRLRMLQNRLRELEEWVNRTSMRISQGREIDPLEPPGWDIDFGAGTVRLQRRLGGLNVEIGQLLGKIGLTEEAFENMKRRYPPG